VGTELVDDLFGRHLTVHFTRGSVSIEAQEPDGRDVRPVLEKVVFGADPSSPAALAWLRVPGTARDLVRVHDADHAALTKALDGYRQLRQDIDDLVVTALTS
jgi:hypothetical protein